MNEMKEKAVLMAEEILRSYDLALQPNNAPTQKVLLRVAQTICEEDEKQKVPIPSQYLSAVFSEARKKWSIAGYKELRNIWEGEVFRGERITESKKLSLEEQKRRHDKWSTRIVSLYSEKYGRDKVIDFCKDHSRAILNDSVMPFETISFNVEYSLLSWSREHSQYISRVYK